MLTESFLKIMQEIGDAEAHKVKEKEIFMKTGRLKALPSEILTEEGEKRELCGYLSQRFAMPYKECMAVLTDVGTEEDAH